jgi:hypothetical protein
MDWLTDPEIQKTIALFGGGLVAIATAAWTVFKYFHGSRTRASDLAPPSQTISADRGGVAAGRDAHVTRSQPSRRKRG